MTTDEVWAMALQEVESDARQPGLWARCFAQANGDEAKAKAAYISERAALHGFDGEQSATPVFKEIRTAPQVVKSAKSRGIYIILGLFFGLLGIHNFYAGRFGIGLAQLLITSILGWFVIGLVITAFWAIYELFTVTKDGAGDAFV